MSNHEGELSQGAHSPTERQGQQPFTASDLPIDAQGRIYHLQITPQQLAPDIIIVGDPGRAENIGADFLTDKEVEHEHRGLVTVTGTFAPTGERATIITQLRTTVTTSGMGTPSLEIVLNELVALNEIDFTTRTRKADYEKLNVVRVGTSGGLQADTALGTPIVTSYTIGLDNSGLFYEAPYPDEHCQRIEKELAAVIERAMDPNSRFKGMIRPYLAKADPEMVAALLASAAELGIPVKAGLTASNSGFFANQGRDISRLKPSVPDIDRVIAGYDPGLGGQRVENMEMEGSFLCHFLVGLGYRGGVVCPAIANRVENTFAHDYAVAVERSTSIALHALTSLRSRSGPLGEH